MKEDFIYSTDFYAINTRELRGRLENLNAIIQGLMANEHVSHRIPSSLYEKQRMMRALMTF